LFFNFGGLKAQQTDPDAWLLDGFESSEGWEKQGATLIEVDGAPKDGKGALKFSMPGTAFRKVKGVKPQKQESPNDGFEGFSFWVKGDGSEMYGSITLCGQHPLWFPFKYSYFFPLKETEWKKYTVAWQDCIPEDPVYPIGTSGGMPPSGIQNIKVGSKWTIYHNNKPMPKFSFSLDRVQLEESVPTEKTKGSLRDLQDVLKSFSEKKPVRILCLGDSITAGTSLGAPDQERYAKVLENSLRSAYGYDGISVESHGVGGAQGNDLRLWMNRDIPAEAPDLIIVMYGYNDKTWGYPKEYYRYSLNDYIDRIAKMTQGKTALLLMPPIPGWEARFYMMDDYAETVRDVGRERNLPICDVNKVFRDLGREEMKKIMADQAHPNPKGHALMAEQIASLLVKK
jgi:lysophospholipase L1-like esterase